MAYYGRMLSQSDDLGWKIEVAQRAIQYGKARLVRLERDYTIAKEKISMEMLKVQARPEENHG